MELVVTLRLLLQYMTKQTERQQKSAIEFRFTLDTHRHRVGKTRGGYDYMCVSVLSVCV